MTENDTEHESESDASRTMPVLARLTSSDVHLAAKALPSKAQQQLARSLGVPITVVTSSGSVADIVRRRSRRLDTPKAAALGRELADACVSETIVALGDHHDDPWYEDLLAVLDPVVARWGVRLVALMLASTADGEFNAAAVCARMLDEDPRFALDALGPVEPDAPAPTVRTPLPTVSDADAAAKREQRKLRRASKKAKQPAKRAEPPSYRRKRAPEDSPDAAKGGAAQASTTTEPRAPTVQGRPVTASSAPMRRATVIGKHDDLRYDDEMVSAVVHVFIPFAVPTDDGQDGKRRPCIVIAACAPDSLVVRPCYSEGGARADDWRSVRVSNPRVAGLDKNSYVDNEEFVIARAQAGPARGWLDRDDWNAL
jgi:hypothetical protein